MTERAGALKRAEDLQRQLTELYRDHETLRKVLQGKKTLIEEMVHHKHEKDEQFEVVRQSLKAKEIEYYALEDAQLGLLQRIEELETDRQDFEAQVARLNAQVVPTRAELARVTEERDALCGQLRDFATDRQDFEAQVARLNAQVVPTRAELARVTEERDALCGQLRDFAATKAENEFLRNDVEKKTNLVRHCKEKAKELADYERHLNKQQMELATNRRLVAELKKKLTRGQFVSKKNLESTVKKSVRESLTERGEELLNASGMEASGSEKLLAQQSQQRMQALEEGKQVVEEDLEMKKREIQLLEQQLNETSQDKLQLKSDLQIAKKKAQECVHNLSESYFESHRYPPCLYQLHQRGLPSSDVESASEMCKTVKVSDITDLRLFHPNMTWCDEFRCLLDELRALPNKDRQACVSFSFLYCSGVITFYRFHVVLVPQVLSCEPEIHPIELEGGAKPKALLVSAHAPLSVKNLTKEFGIATHAKGVLLAPEFKGDIPKLTMRLDELEDIPPGLKEAEGYLDMRILRELQRRYRVFATPRTVPTVPAMGVAMAVI